MLIDILTRKEITWIPFQKETYDPCIGRLTSTEVKAIKDAINKHIDDSGTEVQPAGWIPGDNWSGTPYDPIYTKACKKNFDVSAQFFGIIVWVVFMERQEKWSSGKGYEANGVPIQSRVYFRIEK